MFIIPGDVKTKCVKLSSSGMNSREIYDQYYSKLYDVEYSGFRSMLQRWKKNNKNSSVINHEFVNIDASTQKVEYKSDGSTTFEGIISLMDGEPITPETIMSAHNLDSSKWDVLTYKTNFWQTQAKGGIKLLLYQSKITVKPKKEQISIDDIDNYFEAKDYAKDKLPIDCFNYDESGEILEVDLPDLHAGLLSWYLETGNNYDLKIAKSNFFKCINDIVSRCQNRKFKKIIFATLGDLLHTDNDSQTTTKGTFQQVDGRLTKIFDTTLDMVVDGITLLGILAPVEVIYLSGNHDRITGYGMMKAVEKAFINDKNVTFDTTPNPQKHRLYGVNLIGFTHGDMRKENITTWIYDDAREDFGKCKFAEVHAGHLHSQQTVEKGGMIVRHLPTICNASYWEHQQGYGKNVKTMVCFVWNEKTGLRDMWFNNL